MTPAEELAAAADKLDALSGSASHGPWIEAGMGEFGWSVIGGDFPLTSNFAVETEDGDQGKADAAYIAAMNPLVGKALAAVLRQWAKMIRLDPAFLRRVGGEETLAVARLINGSES